MTGTPVEQQVLDVIGRTIGTCDPLSRLRPEDTHRTLSSMDIEGPQRLLLIAELEAAFSIDLPADLLTAIETFDDLIYYVTIHYTRDRPEPSCRST